MIHIRNIKQATYSPFAERYRIPCKEVRNENSPFWVASRVRAWTTLDHEGCMQTVSYLLR